ncbi:hypothetical protein AMAG_07592 [Allomyces macrogynus ATCC 38327]|uniref:Sfi1 spindle body domain-containing protein n=1 Tax=Allomyces macrogynus (strain ATCC 38327) TaxID=578462 RepID=A0A0L0SJ05_ALLM3|nr:hypothetical protein AMAG_07592 [Allomyces macrogynus ATCC 38327]|eukprot:KNE62365.1 hypothetical protein AMAG_07592 [Allomyces macrogynus ATCC 38327]
MSEMNGKDKSCDPRARQIVASHRKRSTRAPTSLQVTDPIRPAPRVLLMHDSAVDLPAGAPGLSEPPPPGEADRAPFGAVRVRVRVKRHPDGTVDPTTVVQQVRAAMAARRTVSGWSASDHALAQRVWTAWAAYAAARKRAWRMQVKAAVKLQYTTQLRWLVVWRQRLGDVRACKMAQQFRDRHTKRSALRIWVVAAKRAQLRKRQADLAVQWDRHQKMARALTTWLTKARSRAQDRSMSALAQAHARHTRLLACVRHWYAAYLERRDLAPRLARADRWHTLNLAHRALMEMKARARQLQLWQHTLAPVVEAREKQTLAAAWRAWRAMVQEAREKRRQLEQIALEIQERHEPTRQWRLLLSVLAHWRARWQTVDEQAQVALQFRADRTKAVLAHCFSRWNARTQFFRTAAATADRHYLARIWHRLVHRFAAAENQYHHHLARRVWRQWVHRARARVAARKRTLAATTFLRHRRQRTALAALATYAQEQRVQAERKPLATRWAAVRLARRVLAQWVDAVHARQHAFTLERRAAEHARRAELDRAWRAWKLFVEMERLRRTQDRLAEAVRDRAVMSAALVQWVAAWRLRVQLGAIEGDVVARFDRRRARNTLVVWRDAAARQVAARCVVDEFRGKQEVERVRRAFAALRQHVEEKRRKRAAVQRAETARAYSVRRATILRLKDMVRRFRAADAARSRSVCTQALRRWLLVLDVRRSDKARAAELQAVLHKNQLERLFCAWRLYGQTRLLKTLRRDQAIRIHAVTVKTTVFVQWLDAARVRRKLRLQEMKSVHQHESRLLARTWARWRHRIPDWHAVHALNVVRPAEFHRGVVLRRAFEGWLRLVHARRAAMWRLQFQEKWRLVQRGESATMVGNRRPSAVQAHDDRQVDLFGPVLAPAADRDPPCPVPVREPRQEPKRVVEWVESGDLIDLDPAPSWSATLVSPCGGRPAPRPLLDLPAEFLMPAPVPRR